MSKKKYAQTMRLNGAAAGIYFIVLSYGLLLLDVQKSAHFATYIDVYLRETRSRIRVNKKKK